MDWNNGVVIGGRKFEIWDRQR